MRNSTKQNVGVIGLGDMGSNVALVLRRFHPVLYNRNPERYKPFEGKFHCSDSLTDFAAKLAESEKPSIIWMMIPGGEATNQTLGCLLPLLRRHDVVIDASNSIYMHSIENHFRFRANHIYYLDVGCAGGPKDLLGRNVSLMVGGDRPGYRMAKEVLRVVAGKGRYGYVGKSGTGHLAKMIHNTIFYVDFAARAEATELIAAIATKLPASNLNIRQTLRLMKDAPPITKDILEAIFNSVRTGELSFSSQYADGAQQISTVNMSKNSPMYGQQMQAPPSIKVPKMVLEGQQTAHRIGVQQHVTKAALEAYPGLSELSRIIYAAAKKRVTGH